MKTNEEIAIEYLESMGCDEYDIECLLNQQSESEIIKNFSGIDAESPPRIMVYDIETTPLKFWGFRCGKTHLNHSSLDKAHYSYDIICITYCFNDGKPAQALHWGYGAESSVDMIKKFDEIIRTEQNNGTIIIGKNNKRFDDKHINTHRWLNGHDPMPDWAQYTEDLETQLRKHFYLPSMSLDYVSELLGFGGKVKMELSHWTKISNYKKAQKLLVTISKDLLESASQVIFGQSLDYVLTEGKIALDEMLRYGKKDADDTMGIILKTCQHCTFKSPQKQYKGVLRCKHVNCGSFDIVKNGTRVLGGIQYQRFECNTHGGFAGRARILPNGKYGKMI